MADLICPNCKTMIPVALTKEGWCEACGKKIPLYALREAGMTPVDEHDKIAKRIADATPPPLDLRPWRDKHPYRYLSGLVLFVGMYLLLEFATQAYGQPLRHWEWWHQALVMLGLLFLAEAIVWFGAFVIRVSTDTPTPPQHDA